MKVEVSVRIKKGYSIIKEHTLYVEMPHAPETQETVTTLMYSANPLFESICDSFGGAMAEYNQERADAKITKEALSSVETTNKMSYEYVNEINELKKALARKECQMDGLIKGVNNDYVATPDEDNPQLLEDFNAT